LFIDIIGDVFHEGAKLFKNLIFLSLRHILLAEQKPYHGTEILRRDTGIAGRWVMLLNQGAYITDQFGRQL